jgi:hypothetical protein
MWNLDSGEIPARLRGSPELKTKLFCAKSRKPLSARPVPMALPWRCVATVL